MAAIKEIVIEEQQDQPKQVRIWIHTTTKKVSDIDALIEQLEWAKKQLKE